MFSDFTYLAGHRAGGGTAEIAAPDLLIFCRPRELLGLHTAHLPTRGLPTLAQVGALEGRWG